MPYKEQRETLLDAKSSFTVDGLFLKGQFTQKWMWVSDDNIFMSFQCKVLANLKVTDVVYKCWTTIEENNWNIVQNRLFCVPQKK